MKKLSIVKDIGTQKIIAISTNASTRSTIIVISLANTTKGAVNGIKGLNPFRR